MHVLAPVGPVVSVHWGVREAPLQQEDLVGPGLVHADPLPTLPRHVVILHQHLRQEEEELVRVILHQHQQQENEELVGVIFLQHLRKEKEELVGVIVHQHLRQEKKS